MKFLRPAFLKHLFVLRPALRVCVHMRARRKLSSSMLPHSTANRRRGWREGSERRLGPPQKLICNFNIPLFIPTKSGWRPRGDLMKRRLRRKRPTMLRRYKYVAIVLLRATMHHSRSRNSWIRLHSIQ